MYKYFFFRDGLFWDVYGLFVSAWDVSEIEGVLLLDVVI
jgi:hypothetical protein